MSTRLDQIEISTFEDIVKNEFYGWEPAKSDLKILTPHLNDMIQAEGYLGDKMLNSKVNLLVEMLNLRNGIVVLGPRCTGKSTMIKLVSSTINKMCDEEISKYILELRAKFEDKSTVQDKPPSKEEMFEIKKYLTLQGVDE